MAGCLLLTHHAFGQSNNVIANPGFESGTGSWTFFTNGTGNFASVVPGFTGTRSARLTINSGGSNIQFYQTGMVLEANTSYTLTFAAYSTGGRDLQVSIQKHTSPFTSYGLSNRTFDLTTSWQTFRIEFTTSGFSGTITDTRLRFWLAPFAAAGDVYFIDDVELRKTATAPVAPSITAHPASISVVEGQSATFTVSASGSVPLSYQWQRNGVNITGATGTAYMLSTTTTDDNGASFRCIVSNAVGDQASNSATLTVTAAPPPPSSSNLIANSGFESGTGSWSFFTNGTGNFASVAPGFTGTRSARLTFNTGGSNIQLYQTGMLLEANTRYILTFVAYSNTGRDLQVSIQKHTTPFTAYGLSNRTFDITTSWQTFTVEFTTSGFSGTTTDTRLRFWFSPFAAAGDVYFIDDVELRKTVTLPVPPSVTTQPSNISVAEGQTATFTVAASGSAPLAYQWQRNGVNIGGATSASYTTPPVTSADNGAAFRCIVTNGAGSATSNSATLTVQASGPSIVTQPSNLTVTAGQAATFSVAATGTAPLSFQWQRNGVNIAGASGSSYTLSPALLSDNEAVFRCIVSNSAGNATSSAAVLTVHPAPPSSPNLIVNSGFESGTGSWTFFTNGTGSFASVSPGFTGSRAARITITTGGSNIQFYQAGMMLEANTLYTLTFSAYSTTGSDLSVTIQQHTSPNTAYGLSNRTFDLTTEWQTFTVEFTTTDFTGTTTDTRLRFWLSSFAMAGDVYFIDDVELRKKVEPPAIATPPANRSVPLGRRATFSIAATGSTPLALQWQKNGVNISGATSLSYTTPPATAADSGSVFRCVVSNDLGSVTSAGAALRVTQGIDIQWFYGKQQSFGTPGNPTPDINIQGNVNSTNGMLALHYSLNGGTFRALSMGPDTRRLASSGDFNIDIPYSTLLSGNNRVVLRARDSSNAVAFDTVTVNYAPGNTWPVHHDINWSTAGNLQNAVHVLDGLWKIDNTTWSLRPIQLGYDRLVAIGGQTWTDYEVTVPATIHSIDSSGYASPSNGAGVGFILRWPGHSDSPASTAGWQPKTGYLPLGALAWYGYRAGAENLRILGNNLSVLASDNSGRRLAKGVGYTFKARVETMQNGAARYSMKVWSDSTAEPSQWNLIGNAATSDPQRGSILLVAHHVDVSFGNVTVRPLGTSLMFAGAQPLEPDYRETDGADIPATFALKQNYPNPFNPSTAIEFDLPEHARVILKVYDVLGREIETLTDGESTPGRHEALWHGTKSDGLPAASGMYFYRIVATTASGQVFLNQQKMMLLR